MIWNSKESALQEAVDGFIKSQSEYFESIPSKYGWGIYRRDMEPGRVRVIVNGGGGYGPMWLTFAGKNIADASVMGAFHSAPNAYVLYEMGKKIDSGEGLLFLTNNYMGDYLNNDMALELLAMDGIKAKAVYVTDDIYSAPNEPVSNRGGLSGIGQISKIATMASEKGMKLDDVFRIAQKANQRTKTLSVNIREQQAFLGEGFSGEKAARVIPYYGLDSLMDTVISILYKELSEYAEDKFYLSISSSRNLCTTEEYIMLNSGLRALEACSIDIQGSSISTLFDNYNDKGAIISLIACDPELQQFEKPVRGFGFVV